MFVYARFLSKRVLCRKSNIILVFAAIIIVLVFLVMNINTQGLFKNKIESQIHTDLETVETYTEKLSQLPQGSENYLLCESTIEMAQSNIKTFKNMISYVNDKNWKKLYDTYGKVLKNRIQIDKEASQIMQDETKTSLHNGSTQLVYIQYLNDHNLAYEESDFPIYGLSFTTSMMQIILPMMITAICIYVLAQVFTFDYSKGNDISMLYPMQRRQVVFIKLLVGVSTSLFIYFMIISSSFLLATLLSGNSGLDYPIILLNKELGTINAISTFDFFKEWFFLGFMFIVSLTLFSYLISTIIREDVYLFFIVLCVVLGMAYLPTIIDSMKTIAHMLPTTYMNCVNVAYGNVSTQYANTSISVFTGFLVLTISIIVQLMICFLYTVCGLLHFNESKFKIFKGN